MEEKGSNYRSKKAFKWEFFTLCLLLSKNIPLMTFNKKRKSRLKNSIFEKNQTAKTLLKSNSNSSRFEFIQIRSNLLDQKVFVVHNVNIRLLKKESKNVEIYFINKLSM